MPRPKKTVKQKTLSLRQRIKHVENWGPRLDFMWKMLTDTMGIVRGLVALNMVLVEKGLVTEIELENARQRLSGQGEQPVESAGHSEDGSSVHPGDERGSGGSPIGSADASDPLSEGVGDSKEASEIGDGAPSDGEIVGSQAS